jgi:hypothetical protein
VRKVNHKLEFYVLSHGVSKYRKAKSVSIEIIQACESGNVSKSEIGRHYNLSSSTLSIILKNKDKIKSAVLTGNVPDVNKKLRGTENSGLESVHCLLCLQIIAQQTLKTCSALKT